MLHRSSNQLRWANVSAFALMVMVNGLAGSTTIIGGRNTAQISDANPTLITPAGYVFSIWGVIYVLLGVFAVYQALPGQRASQFQSRIGWLFVLSCITNMVWLFLWQSLLLEASTVLMFLLLSTLILIYLRLGVGKSKDTIREKLAVHLPFSVYLGWITIASIANVAVTLVSVGWAGFGISPTTWATLVVAIALLISVLILATRRDLAYALVVIWALVGIAVKQSGNQNIVLLTETSAIIILLSLSATIVLSKLKRR
jgi:benzodiazapine receptor